MTWRRSSGRCSKRAEHYKYIDLPLSNYTSASYRQDCRQGGKTGRHVDVQRLQLQRTLDALARRGGSGRRNRRPRSRWSGARKAAARRKLRSSGTDKSKFAPSSALCLIRKSHGRPTTRVGALITPPRPIKANRRGAEETQRGGSFAFPLRLCGGSWLWSARVISS